MRTLSVVIDSVGIWDIADKDHFKKEIPKNFLGTICIAKKPNFNITSPG
jgi:hypothetical protein